MQKVIVIGSALLLAHLVLKEQRKKLPVVRYVDKVPFSGYNAVTLPPFGIYIHKRHENNNVLLLHELKHWKQYQQMGLLGFYLNYVGQYLAHGYDGSPMEREARTAAGESDYCVKNYTECVRNGTAKTVHDQAFRI